MKNNKQKIGYQFFSPPNDMLSENKKLEVPLNTFPIKKSHTKNIFNDNENQTFYFKIIAVGDECPEKAHMFQLLGNGEDKENYYKDCKRTIGVAYLYQNFSYGDINLLSQIWDINGRKSLMLRPYCSGTSYAIIIANMKNPNLFDNINFWFNKLKLSLNKDNNSDSLVTFLGICPGTSTDIGSNRISDILNYYSISYDQFSQQLSKEFGINNLHFWIENKGINNEDIMRKITYDVYSHHKLLLKKECTEENVLKLTDFAEEQKHMSDKSTQCTLS